MARFLTASVIVGCIASSSWASAPSYLVRELDFPNPPINPFPFSLNNSGTVVGSTFNTESFYFDGVTWEPSGAVTTFSSAYALQASEGIRVSDDGTIVGAGSFDALTQVEQAFQITPDGSVQMLDRLLPGDDVASAAMDRSDQGRIVGWSASAPGPFPNLLPSEAVYWEAGQAHSIGRLPGGDVATAQRINNSNVIIGQSNNASSTLTTGFVWTEAEGMRQVPALTTRGRTILQDINDAGTIVGAAEAADGSFASSWNGPDGTAVPLEQLGIEFSSIALAINESGDAVGSIDTDDSQLAVLWSGGEIYNLNDLFGQLDYTLTRALDINDRGEILVEGINFDRGEFTYAVLSPIPTPGTAALLLTGVLGYTRRTRRTGGSR